MTDVNEAQQVAASEAGTTERGDTHASVIDGGVACSRRRADRLRSRAQSGTIASGFRGRVAENGSQVPAATRSRLGIPPRRKGAHRVHTGSGDQLVQGSVAGGGGGRRKSGRGWGAASGVFFS